MPTKPHGCSQALTKQLLKWSLTDATGISSLFMAGVAAFGLKHRDQQGEQNLPGDFSDLWRCIKLVNSCASFRQAFPALRQVSPEWDEFIERWDELVELGFANKAKSKKGKAHFVAMDEKYRRYRQILDEIRHKLAYPPHENPHPPPLPGL